MNGIPNFDLVHATVAEQLRWARPSARPAPVPVTPARVTVWGPRASRRTESVVVHLPEPRRPIPSEVSDAVLLDA